MIDPYVITGLRRIIKYSGLSLLLFFTLYSRLNILDLSCITVAIDSAMVDVLSLSERGKGHPPWQNLWQQ